MNLNYFSFNSEQGIFYCIYSDSFNEAHDKTLHDTSICYLGVGERNFKFYAGKLKKAYKDINLQYENNPLISSEILDFLKGKKHRIDLKTFFLTGTEFEQAVWNKAKEIPYGKKISYKELSEEVAKNIGKPRSYRAVGNALGKNPVILLVPCHRIIKSNGDIGNFSSGIPLKIMLLKLEANTVLVHKDSFGSKQGSGI